MPFISTVRGTFGPQSENRGVDNSSPIRELLRQNPNASGLPTGGTITTAGGYRIHTFTNVGSASFNLGTSLSSLNVEYLVIAGGGAGGAGIAGGGGAGGYRTGSLELNTQVNTVFIGTGAAGQPAPHNVGLPGSVTAESSVFSSITSTGGGHGGPYPSYPLATKSGTGGSSGGVSGGIAGGGGGGAGGAGTPATVPNNLSAAPSIPGQGHPGGHGSSTYPQPGGGPGPGGIGLSSSITGTSVTRGGGGGGGWHGAGNTYLGNPGLGVGGPGGGGNGHSPGRTGTGGATNTGGGGGSGEYPSPDAGFPGGPGIVVVRYLV